ncbi:hypothetical protein FRB90_012289 [Tulasnella sp. 427]|nr:hypothetical protein FRB90_012289 [Tulasnella sp. 427]
MPQSDLPLLQLPEDKSNQGVTMQEEAAPEVVSHYRFSLEGSRKVSESPTQSPAQNHLHPLLFHTQLPEGPKSSESSAKGILRVKREGEGSPDVLVDRIAQRVNRLLGLSVYGESDEDADRNDEKAVESNAMSGTFEANPSATPEVWPRSSVAILSADVASFESLPKSLDGQDLGSGVSTCRPIRMVTRPPSPEDERLSRAGQNYARPRQNQSGLEANRSHCRKSSTSSDAPTNAHRRGSLGDEKDNLPARNRFGPSFQLQRGYEGFTRVISSAESMKSNTRKIIIVHEDGKAPTHYQLGNCIGKGQIGSVYRALEINTGRIVAVKRISLAGLPESEIIQLTKEVHLMKRLCHPSIVQYEGIVRNDDSLDIVLEYVENGSVGQALKAFGKFEERLVARYATKILEGLHYLHEQQVVHCNLRGANILSTRNGNIKLSDFGLSLTLSAINNETGIPNWSEWRCWTVNASSSTMINAVAPEVIELKGASAASDIWSLGCTIVELLTGEPPYSELGTSLSVMFRIVEDDTAPIPDCCSKPLRDFLSQCFRKDPTERPTAESLFEHPWLKQMWGSHKVSSCKEGQSVSPYADMIELQELRPSDSIPFLRRLSNDVQGLQRSTQILAEP